MEAPVKTTKTDDREIPRQAAKVKNKVLALSTEMVEILELKYTDMPKGTRNSSNGTNGDEKRNVTNDKELLTKKATTAVTPSPMDISENTSNM
jgi:hypothetical protein